MPELPEVETVRRGLAPALEGARVTRVEQRRADLRFPFPERLAERLTGARVTSLARRAKYLLATLSTGETLILHLGMSGSFRVEPLGRAAGADGLVGEFHHPRSTAAAHDHLVLEVEGGEAGPARITYNDPRRFGFVLAVRTDELPAHPMIAGLGVEPLGNELSGALLARLFAGKAAPLKSALLDQTLVAGIGNIYACEALHRARLSPRRAAGTIAAKDGGPTARAEALAGAIREVLAAAVEAGGSSLRDHRQVDGELGYFQHSFGVYDREDEPCPRAGCRGVVTRVVQANRSTFYCPVCQR